MATRNPIPALERPSDNASDTRRKPYRRPHLSRLGTIRELTLSGGSTAQEGFNGKIQKVT